MSEYIEIPVLSGFMYDKPIGILRVLKGELPEAPIFHFAIGYIKEPYELICISPVSDKSFKGSE